MNTVAEESSRWIYEGAGSGKGQIHRVIYHSMGQIITWSDSKEPGQGHSWKGDLAEFLAQFKKQ